MTTVQLVSKPVVPPLNDATKVLVHGILAHRTHCRYRFFGTPESHVLEGPHVRCDVVTRVHRFQPTLSEQVSTLVRLLRPGSRADVYHCLFTPNPRTSMVLRIVLRMLGKPVVHTLCSSPDDWTGIRELLFADRIVAVSEWAAQHLHEQGVPNVVHIPPGIAMPSPGPARMEALRESYRLPAERPCLLFPGDYEYSQAHPVILAALPRIMRLHPRPVLVFACRTKTPQAVAVEAEVRQQVDAMGFGDDVRFLREVDDFESLLAIATLVLFPVRSLRRKMDIPLTLLQTLALRRPIVTSTVGPLAELLSRDVGLGVVPGDAGSLADAVEALLSDPCRMTAMGGEGYRLVQERYSAPQMAAAYEQLYRALAMNGPDR